MTIKKMMVVVVVLALKMIASPAVNAKITYCQDVIGKMMLPCEQYLRGNGGIKAPCCEGAQALNQIAASTEDRQVVCKCFKQVGPYLGVEADRAQQLTNLCKIDVGGITIDYNVDCSKIK